MSLSVMTSRGQITIPKVVRDILHLMPSDKVIITVEKDHAILKPLHGNILDIGGSIQIPESERPIDFHKVRGKVQKALSLYSIKSIDFIDAYNAVSMKHERVEEIYSYDKDFDGIEFVKKIEP